MLQSMHEHIKGWIAGTVIGLISLSFVLWGVQYYLHDGQNGGAAVAKVNGHKISQGALNTAFQRLQRGYMIKSGHPPSALQREQLKQLALQNLILSNVLLQSAQDSGFRIGREQIDQVITSMPELQQNGRFSPTKLQQLLYSNSINQAKFVSQTANMLMINQIRAGIQSSAFVLPMEWQQAFNLLHQKRSFSYVIIPSGAFSNKIKVTPAMMKNYYQHHRQSFAVPEQVSIAYLQLSPQEIAKQVSVSDKEITNYYKSSGNTRPLSTVRTQIENMLRQQKTNAILTQKSDQLSNITYTNPNTLEPAAKSLKLKIHTTLLFSKEGGKQGLSANAKVINVAFSDDVLKQGNNSDVVELKDGSLIVLRVKQHQPSRIPPLRDIADTIKKQMVAQLAQAQSALVAGQIQTAITKGKSPVDAVKQYDLSWHSKVNIGRDDKSLPPAIVQAAFSLTPVKSHDATVAVLPNGNSVVVRLAAIKSANFKHASQQQRSDAQKALADTLGQLEYQLYVKSAHDHAKIKIVEHQ